MLVIFYLYGNFHPMNSISKLALVKIGIPFFLLILLPDSLPGQSSAYRIDGIALDNDGILLQERQTVLKDSSGKIIQRGKTTAKFLKRYGGGKFKFEQVPPGNYLLEIETGEKLKIIRNIEILDNNLNLGSIKPKKIYPPYKLPEISTSELSLIRPIRLELDERDTINIKHILIGIEGYTYLGRIDSISRDTLYYKDLSNNKSNFALDSLYLAYNDYGKLVYKSRSLLTRLKELEKRDGYLITLNNDSLPYDKISFESSMNNPGLALFNVSDSIPAFYKLTDIYKIRTGEGYIENSVRKGFLSGAGLIGGYILLRMLREKSFTSVTSILPHPIMKKTGSQYQSAILIFPLVTIGWMAYDYYTDKRSNYILPRYREEPFPKKMYVFSLPLWIGRKIAPVADPILNSKLVKKLRKKKNR
ncbi:MAG: hypothetical protein V3S48_04040 [Candidatus Neomarinimicrobiota bacterium]